MFTRVFDDQTEDSPSIFGPAVRGGAPSGTRKGAEHLLLMPTFRHAHEKEREGLNDRDANGLEWKKKVGQVDGPDRSRSSRLAPESLHGASEKRNICATNSLRRSGRFT